MAKQRKNFYKRISEKKLDVSRPDDEGAWTTTSCSPALSCDMNGEETITSNYKVQD